MKYKSVVIAGGSGFLGTALMRHYKRLTDRIVILTRGPSRTVDNVHYIYWDGHTPGEWCAELEGCDVVINLNGKSVDCRYTERNKALIYATRLEATRVLGKAIQQCVQPPKLWINASSATIYRHATDRDMDEHTGEIGSGFSVDVCQLWEQTFHQFQTPSTRKIVMRTAIVLGLDGGALIPLRRLARLGMGGRQGSGSQYVSWLHIDDFVRIVDYFITHPETTGVYNVAAPNPITNACFMRTLRQASHVSFGLPMPEILLKLGAVLIGTETELILKSRRVVPRHLLETGYRFAFPEIKTALNDLCTRK